MSDGDNSVERLIRDIHEASIQSAADVKALADTVDRHAKFIDGNGREPAHTRLTILENDRQERLAGVAQAGVGGKLQTLKWEVIGRWAQTFGVLAAILLGIANARGWL